MTDTTHADVYAALAAFQAEAPAVTKNRQGRGHDGTYTYADLAAVAAAATPILHRHGLVYLTPPAVREGAAVITGRIRHVSTGTEVEGTLPLFGRHSQELGSSITYARRYLLGCLTGLITEDDDDGAAVIGRGTAPEPAVRSSTSQADAARAAIDGAADVADLRVVYTEQGIGSAPEAIRSAWYARYNALKAESIAADA